MIFGVCAGIADHFSIGPTLVRLAAVALAVMGQAPGTIVLYIIAAIVIPAEE